MKASELVEILQELIEEWGDRPVMYHKGYLVHNEVNEVLSLKEDGCIVLL